MLKICIFGAHPDDLETGMGATLHALVDLGHDVQSIIATCGTTQQEHAIRMNETFAAHALLGAKPPSILGWSENDFHTDEKTVKQFYSYMEVLNPDVIFTHWPVDVHPHHRALAALTLGPCLLKGKTTEVFCYEAASATHSQSLGFIPTHYVDTPYIYGISKGQAIRAFTSQQGDQLATVFSALGESRGKECGRASAEGFVRLTRHAEILPELQELFMPTKFVLPKASWG